MVLVKISYRLKINITFLLNLVILRSLFSCEVVCNDIDLLGHVIPFTCCAGGAAAIYACTI